MHIPRLTFVLPIATDCGYTFKKFVVQNAHVTQVTDRQGLDDLYLVPGNQ